MSSPKWQAAIAAAEVLGLGLALAYLLHRTREQQREQQRDGCHVLAPGARVRLAGLRKDILNDRLGTVTGNQQVNGRWRVHPEWRWRLILSSCGWGEGGGGGGGGQ